MNYYKKYFVFVFLAKGVPTAPGKYGGKIPWVVQSMEFELLRKTCSRLTKCVEFLMQLCDCSHDPLVKTCMNKT